MSRPDEMPGASPPTKGNDPRRPKASGGRLWGIILLCGLMVGGGMWWARRSSTPADKKGVGPGRMEVPPVPVVAGTVAEKDVPIFLEGLGTVQAFNTVSIRARVDGQLKKVAFTEGQDVRAGDLLALIDPDPYRASMEQAAAKKGQDEALLANAQVDLKRYGDLLANEGVTQQVYDTQKALVNQLQAAVKADQAAVESAKVQLAYTTIVSPIDGRTGIRQMDEGNMVRANDSNGLVTITQLRPISVVFTLPQQTLGRIQKEAAAGGDLAVLAVERDNTSVLGEGKLAVIDNQIDTTTATIKLKATFPNTELHLWPGQFVNARLLVTTRKASPVVPASVIQRGPDGAFAWVILDDQTVTNRAVKVAQIEQGEALIDEGLRPGERVVVDGQYKLQKGSRIKTADAAGARPGGAGSGRSPKAGTGGTGPGNRGTNSARSTGEGGGTAPRKAKP